MGLTIKELSIGQKAQFAKTVTETDVYMFAGITGDMNPVHINKVYAEGTMFKERIAHGMLSAGFISNVIGTQLPGTGSIYLGQNLKFKSPVHIGDTVTTTVEVVAIDEEKNKVTLRTTCENQEGKLLVDGEALIMPPK